MISRSSMAVIVIAVLGLAAVAAYETSLRAVSLVVALVLVAMLFIWTQHAQYQKRESFLPVPVLRAFTLVFALLVTAGAVALTQPKGAVSPFIGVLFFPILLAALSYGFVGSVLMGTAVSAAFLLIGMAETGLNQAPTTAVLTHVVVFILVAVAGGACTEEMRRVTDEAQARARTEKERAAEEAARAEESEAFLDTSVMMGSVLDLETTLSIALMRLAELVPCDVCAVYLRDGDAAHLQLALLTGLPANAAVRSLPREEAEAQWGTAPDARLWPDVVADSEGLGALAALDPEARSVIVAPLRTLESFYGLIYVSARREEGLQERHRNLVYQFARHVVFPIQRVRLQAMATTDAMTGLDNYRSFRLRLADEVRRAYRYGHPVSLILIDIDFFKRLNDTFGHPSGDAVLTQIGMLIRKSLRGIDVPARYGGEEMAIVCPETSEADALTIAERLRATVAEHRFTLPEGQTVQVTISGGVATLPGQAVGDAALVEQADRALYLAKTHGRNAIRTARDVDLDSRDEAA